MRPVLLPLLLSISTGCAGELAVVRPPAPKGSCPPRKTYPYLGLLAYGAPYSALAGVPVMVEQAPDAEGHCAR